MSASNQAWNLWYEPLADLLIFNDSAGLTLYIMLVFVLASVVKGMLGMGLPAILMVMLTFIMPPIDAIRLITLPMLFLNIVQFSRGPAPLQAVKGYWIFALVMMAVIGITAYNITAIAEEILFASIGVAMIMFALPSLFGMRFSIGSSFIWQVLGGGLAGILGGLSTIWSPAVVIYLMGRGVQKDDFVGVTGFLFMSGSITFAAVLGAADLLTFDAIVPSMAGLVVALIGFRIGEIIRNRINRDAFRKIVLVAFLILGARLVLISVL
jgi:uncharacterized membrane protein YfcA